MGNYRPVSNIPFLSKVIERVVAQQLNSHLTRNGLHDDLQSAYKTGTSTETAILRIKTDIETVLDDGDAVLLVLLDLSAAFDTIDHNLLIERLRVEAGLTETTLRWVQSYLSDRIQAVKINNSVSSDVPLSTGVPQGSVLGPLLFLVYLLPLRRVINQYAINRHGFADDTQLYSRLSVKNTTMRTHQVNIMEECIASVRTWMTVNKLKLNDGKTEIMVVASPHNQCRLTDIRLKIGEAILTPRSTVKNLGAALDSTLSMEAQVSSVVRKMYFNIRRISKVKRHLTKEACAKVINATVISHLDYHNALLLGLIDRQMHRLQMAQNNAARCLTGTCYRQHISPVLQQLHWLPVRQRVVFKVLTTIHKALHTLSAPTYMRELCPVYQPHRTLRSSSDKWKLVVKKSSNKYGARAIQTLGAQLWNELPLELRVLGEHRAFRKNLKTLLFKREYGL